MPPVHAMLRKVGCSVMGTTLESWSRSGDRNQALFVDIQFESDRADPSLPRLLESLCRYKADGIPVFMAAGSEKLGRQPGLNLRP